MYLKAFEIIVYRNRTTLFKLEKRERALTITEEGLIQRKEALERAYSNRTSDAQVLCLECYIFYSID